MGADELLERLRADGLRLAVAESCTGGLVGGALTDVAGASDVFLGGLIAYDNAVKASHLKVPAKTLRRNGAVSAATAEAMAHGVRTMMGADMAIAVTGVAGPDGTRRKPAGTVWVAILGPEHLLNVHKLKIKGDRAEVRRRTVEEALRLALENLREGEKEGVA